MDFQFENVAALREPTSAELEAWFAKNAERFALPPRVSFGVLYFYPDRRGAPAREDASQALVKLAGESKDAPVATSLADPFTGLVLPLRSRLARVAMRVSGSSKTNRTK